MNLCKVFFLFLLFSSSLLMIFFGTLAGDFTCYTSGSLIMLAVSAYLFTSFSNKKGLILLLIVIFLYLRYIPIVKFNQPLKGDPVFDLETAEWFENNGHIGIIGRDTQGFLGESRMQQYSGWPLIHLLAIAIHDVTGLSLFDVFTYFPPLVALGSLLFVYLLANQIFNDRRISALSGLMFATFSVTMRWQTLMIRQNIAYTLALMGIYLYVKGQTIRKIKIVALSLLVFGTLSVAHHLTTFEIFLILCTSLFISWLFRSDLWRRISTVIARKILRTPSLETTIPHLFTLTLCLFVGTSMFLWWTTYAGPINVERMAVVTFSNVFSSLLGTEVIPGIPKPTQSMGDIIDFYDILSFASLFFYVAATFCGIFILVRERGKVNRYKTLLYGLLAVPLLLILVYVFVQTSVTRRHLLFLLIPVFLLTAKTIHDLDKKILVICLLIILIPVPFKLDNLLWETPTFIYDRSYPYEFPVGEKVYFTPEQAGMRAHYFRSDDVLVAASFIAVHTNGDLMADFYVGVALQFYYDAQKVYFLSLPKYLSNEYILLIHQRNFDTYKLVAPADIAKYIDELPSLANCVYSNGEAKGWKKYGE